MRVGSTFNVAFRALRRNKMRSVLTALGIIIGVAAVIAMVGIGNGAKAQVEAQIASLGQNLILIFSGSTTSSGIRTGWGGAGTLKVEDAKAIRREVPGVTAVSEEVWTGPEFTPHISVSDSGLSVAHVDPRVAVEPRLGDVTQVGTLITSSASRLGQPAFALSTATP